MAIKKFNKPMEKLLGPRVDVYNFNKEEKEKL